jgi:hypothetical protein
LPLWAAAHAMNLFTKQGQRLKRCTRKARPGSTASGTGWCGELARTASGRRQDLPRPEVREAGHGAPGRRRKTPTEGKGGGLGSGCGSGLPVGPVIVEGVHAPMRRRQVLDGTAIGGARRAGPEREKEFAVGMGSAVEDGVDDSARVK